LASEYKSGFRVPESVMISLFVLGDDMRARTLFIGCSHGLLNPINAALEFRQIFPIAPFVYVRFMHFLIIVHSLHLCLTESTSCTCIFMISTIREQFG
jgi:hypothetical protein